MAAFFWPMIPYLVSQFAQETMTNLVRECFGAQFPDILGKTQVAYAYNYLKRLGAKSVLLEFDYIDKDFLEDFTRYYAKRYRNDGHHCARMHFFANTIDHRCISSVLEGEENSQAIVDQMKSSYLGFMVIKPLPKTFIGKTCLKVMDDEVAAPGRKRRLHRPYEVDLFGIKLSVDSIAFQEQDKVVAACATTAIWAAFHALNWRSVRSIRSCSEITMNALNDGQGSSNSFPNTGLSTEEILRSIDAEGLRHHLESIQRVDQQRFVSTVIGHIESHLPMIFVGDVFTIEPKGRAKRAKLTYRGGHAICILGYKSDSEEVLYIHDDRYGPYTRAKIVSTADYLPHEAIPAQWALGIQSMDGNGNWSKPSELIVPSVLIAPTDQKTRLPFDYARGTCEAIVHALKISPGHYLNLDNLSFQIRLREISSLRQEIRQTRLPIDKGINDPANEYKLSDSRQREWRKLKVGFLTQGFARFQWVAQFFHEGEPAFKVLIDATDIPQGDAVTAVYLDDVLLAEPYLRYLIIHADLLKTEGHGTFFQSFLRRLVEEDESMETYLNETYGEVRAPLYLKALEVQGGEIFHNPNTSKPLYDAPGKRLVQLHNSFNRKSTDYLIWAIAHDGALIVGKEHIVDIYGRPEKCGHPSITGFKPARIAGELWKAGSNAWQINSKSGRYSGDYVDGVELLQNAMRKFRSFFPGEAFDLKPADDDVTVELGPCAAMLKEVREAQEAELARQALEVKEPGNDAT